MRIVVLSSANGWHYCDFRRVASSQHEVNSVSFDCLAAGIGDQRTFNLSADCVIVRTMPAGSLQQIVFRMDLLGQLAETGVLVLNSPKSIEAAVDKYLSLAKLQAAGIAVPETLVSQNLNLALEQFEALRGKVVVKPLFGSMGNGILRLDCVADSKEVFEGLIEAGNVIYQQEFIEHDGFDIRLLVIGDEVLGMKRTNANSWITNISQGGTGHPYSPTAGEKDLAINAARAVGAHFAGVDLMYESGTGRQLIIEVNAVPGWQAISQILDCDVAKMMLREIKALFERV